MKSGSIMDYFHPIHGSIKLLILSYSVLGDKKDEYQEKPSTPSCCMW